MTEEHHTPEQVAKAFAYAPVILQKLRDAGVRLPCIELYGDASGRVYLGDTDDKITNRQYRLAQDLLHTARPYEMLCVKCLDGEPDHPHKVGVTFCCGLVTAAEENS